MLELRYSFAALLSLLLGPAVPSEPDQDEEPRRPNVVFVLLDDADPSDLRAYGNEESPTPTIDRIAREGMLFTNFYSPASTCSPARAGFLTGQHPSRFGWREFLPRYSPRGLPADVEGLGRLFQEAGYATGQFGKWHVGDAEERFRPPARGFDRSVIRNGNGRYRNPVLTIDDGEPTETKGHLTGLTTNHAIEFMREHRGEPFFVNLWYHAVHTPYSPPPTYLERHPSTQAGRFAALLEHTDDQIRRVMSTLRMLRVSDNTILIVGSDNGGSKKANESELRGAKYSLFDGGLRVPLIVRWPKVVPAGTRTDVLGSGLDLLPTLAEVLGRQVECDGRSLLPVLRGEVDDLGPRTMFWEQKGRGTWEMDEIRYAVRRDDWKLVQQFEKDTPSFRLYDLAKDPTEELDASDEHPEVVEELVAAYDDWRERTSIIRPREAGRSTDGELLDPTRIDRPVTLRTDARLRIDTSEFSLSLRAVPEVVDLPQTLAELPGSWRLHLTEEGRVRLVAEEGRVRFVGEEGDDRAVLLSESRVRAGAPVDVAFTVYGQRLGTSTIRLFVDGELCGQHDELEGIAPRDAGLTFGARADGTEVLRGTICQPIMRLRDLSAEEIAADHAERTARSDCAGD